MKKIWRFIIRFLLRKRSLISILFFLIMLFLNQLAALIKRNEIINFLDRLSEKYSQEWLNIIIDLYKTFILKGDILYTFIILLFIVIILGLIWTEIRSKEMINTGILQNDIKELQGTTAESLLKLTNPLPIDLYSTGISIIFENEPLSDYLPLIREVFNTKEIITTKSEKALNTNRSMKNENVPKEVLGKLHNQHLKIVLQITNPDDPFKYNERKLHWEFNHIINLVNPNTHLLYFIDFKNQNKEYFKLSIDNIEPHEQETRLTYFNRISNALELCNQKVFLSISIGKEITSKNFKMERLSLKDERKKGFYLTQFQNEVHIMKSRANEVQQEFRFPSEYKINYVTAALNCLDT